MSVYEEILSFNCYKTINIKKIISPYNNNWFSEEKNHMDFLFYVGQPACYNG